MEIKFFDTYIGKNVRKYLEDVVKSTFLSEGEIVRRFESKLSKDLNLSNPVALNSGTSALHLALALAGVDRNSEVILPAQTFVATGLAILYQGARPVFADIQYDTGNIDPNSIKMKLSRRTRAIIPVHWGGYPCDMDEINKLAKEKNIVVIEDAAHALGAKYKKKSVGSLSRFTAFSFQAIKHLTTGDGGALCCKEKNDYKIAKRNSWFGIDREDAKQSILGEREYDISTIGYKYHMNNVAASIGLANIEEVYMLLKHRNNIAKIYQDELKNIHGLKLLDYKNDRESAYWLFTILVENRVAFIKKLKSVDIPSSVVHLGIDKNSIFGGVQDCLINQRKFDQTQISIPIHASLSNDQAYYITKIIKSGW